MEDSLDLMSWEERFRAAFHALLKMEARAERAESGLINFENMQYGGYTVSLDPALKERAERESLENHRRAMRESYARRRK